MKRKQRPTNNHQIRPSVQRHTHTPTHHEGVARESNTITFLFLVYSFCGSFFSYLLYVRSIQQKCNVFSPYSLHSSFCGALFSCFTYVHCTYIL